MNFSRMRGRLPGVPRGEDEKRGVGEGRKGKEISRKKKS